MVVVDCTVETQIRRVMARNALARNAIEDIIAAQSSRAARRRAADVVVYNDQLPLDALQSQVDALAAVVRAMMTLPEATRGNMLAIRLKPAHDAMHPIILGMVMDAHRNPDKPPSPHGAASHPEPGSVILYEYPSTNAFAPICGWNCCSGGWTN